MASQSTSVKKKIESKISKEKREARRRSFYQDIDAGSLDLRAAIKNYRKMLGLNQRDFAAFVGISPRILLAFEQGSGNPTLETLQKMLKGSGLELKLGRK